MKYYITQSIVEMVDGRITGREVILTRADSKVDKDSARFRDVRYFKSKLEALGIPNLHVNKYEKKRYNKLLREQNKYRKDNKLTVADLARMQAEADKAFDKGDECLESESQSKEKTYLVLSLIV